MLGSLIELHIPALSSRHTDNSNETVTVSGGGVSVPNLPDLYPTLLPLLEHLHCLWELVLTAEPVVVLAPSPFQCSSTVQALTTIIQPLRYLNSIVALPTSSFFSFSSFFLGIFFFSFQFDFLFFSILIFNCLTFFPFFLFLFLVFPYELIFLIIWLMS